MGMIKILDQQLANKIAAGEVVERPSSVVKELVENAIDAQATQIDVSVEEGGLQFIRVKDNGCGIAIDDVQLAFVRHATSKIYRDKDLFSIRSLGFRGEALPSIAAVGKVELITATDASGLGQRVTIEGGMVKSCAATSARQGTEMIVRHLFYHTPARLKYMKTIQTELGHVSDVLYRLALSYPNIAFTLKHHEHVLLQTLGKGNLKQVIAAIYGVKTSKGMIEVQGEQLDFQLYGYISKPELTRSNRHAMSWMINGRYVRSPALQQALLRAYHTLLPNHRYPLTVLHIQLHPSLVDVNVHPAKLEVRFSKEIELCSFVEQVVKNILYEQTLIPETFAVDAKKQVVIEQAELQWKATNSGDEAGANQPKPLGAFVTEQEPKTSIQEVRSEYKAGATAYKQPEAITGKIGTKENDELEENRQLMDKQSQAMQGAPFPTLLYIGHMHGTYLLASNETALYVIDQHAAHERIHYEDYVKRFSKPIKASQDLLLPMTLEYTPAEASCIRERIQILEQIGILIEPFGGQTFLVRSYPYWFPKGAEESTIRKITDWILQETVPHLATLRETAAILCACKAAVKANQRLTIVEAESLFVRLQACRQPFTCPHGRPIIVRFTTYELKKMFKRVM